MPQMRVVLVENDPITRANVREMLAEEDIITIGECGDGMSAVSMIKSLRPDLVIMDIKMPVLDGIEAASILNKEKIAPILLLTAYSQSELIEKAKNAGVLAYIVKPVTKQSLIPACMIAHSRYQEFSVLRSEIDNLNDALEARKMIEKAKGILQREYNLDEEGAFKKLKRMSMKQSKSMKEVAKAIIITYDE